MLGCEGLSIPMSRDRAGGTWPHAPGPGPATAGNTSLALSRPLRPLNIALLHAPVWPCCCTRQRPRVVCAACPSEMTPGNSNWAWVQGFFLTTRNHWGGGGSPPPHKKLAQISLRAFGRSKILSGTFGAKRFRPKVFFAAFAASKNAAPLRGRDGPTHPTPPKPTHTPFKKQPCLGLQTSGCPILQVMVT